MTVRPLRSMTSVPRAATIEHLAAAADRENAAHLDRDRFERAVVRIGRQHAAVGEDEIGCEGCMHVGLAEFE